MKNVFRLADSETVFQTAAGKLDSYINNALDVPVLFMSSGGSALKLLNLVKSAWLSPLLTITVLDERFSSDPSINNFSQIAQTQFYKNAVEAGSTFIDTQVNDGEGGTDHAKRIQESLKKWRTDNKNGVIIATFGMGADGHISGVMPYPENEEYFESTFNNQNWVVHYNAGSKNPFPLRTTTTLHFIREQIDKAVWVISGDDKKEALEKALSESGSIAATPARIIHDMKEVSLYTDIS